MRLTLQHTANPDIGGGYWEPPVDRKLTYVTVDTLQGAREAFIAWRLRNSLGCGNLPVRSGQLRDDDGTVIGRFSYNGRFWGPDDKEIPVPRAEVATYEH